MSETDMGAMLARAEVRERQRSLLRRWWTASDKMTLIAQITLLVIIAAAIIGPYMTPHDPLRISLGERLRPPSAGHLLGTDQAGRDILSRLIAGTRITLISVIVVLSMAGALGIFIGGIAGFIGGTVDEILMRISDLIMAFPALVIVMALAAAMGAGLGSAIIAVAFVRWPRYARLVRGQVLSFKNKAFVEAARAMGAPPWRILVRHILVNSLDPILVRMTVDAGYVILTTSSLSFVGLGAQPPEPEWGAMVAEGRSFLLTAPWLTIFPGLGIALGVLVFTLVGDQLRDRLDPALRTLSGG